MGADIAGRRTSRECTPPNCPPNGPSGKCNRDRNRRTIACRACWPGHQSATCTSAPCNDSRAYNDGCPTSPCNDSRACNDGSANNRDGSANNRDGSRSANNCDGRSANNLCRCTDDLWCPSNLCRCTDDLRGPIPFRRYRCEPQWRNQPSRVRCRLRPIILILSLRCSLCCLKLLSTRHVVSLVRQVMS